MSCVAQGVAPQQKIYKMFIDTYDQGLAVCPLLRAQLPTVAEQGSDGNSPESFQHATRNKLRQVASMRCLASDIHLRVSALNFH